MNTCKIKVTGIKYDIDYDSVAEILNNELGELDEDELDIGVTLKTDEINESLPHEMIFELDCDDEEDIDDIKEMAIEYVTEETGWCVDSVASCEIIFTFYQKDRIKSFTKSV